MQVGQEIVCIDASDVALTVGKIYVIKSVGKTVVVIENDLGKASPYVFARFSENIPKIEAKKAAPVKKEAPPPINWLEIGRKELHEHAPDASGLSSFVIVHEDGITEHYDMPCHYRINAEKAPVHLLYGLSSDAIQLTSPKCKEQHKIICEYVMNESPFSEAFIDKDYAKGLENEILMNADKDIHMLAGACIALRTGFEENKLTLPTWSKLLEMGVNKHIAFILTHCFTYVEEDDNFVWRGTNHHMWMDMSMRLAPLLKFMKEGYAYREVKPYRVRYNGFAVYNNITDTTYGDDSLRHFIETRVEATEQGEGWEKSTCYLNEEIAKLANALTEKMEQVK
eukprot:gnl/Spiro4/1476_TR792_c0_g1_i1.p1 gnl/Spiro4/1476_TR792_c0_g1~~gnl/Spiro4/1476_TR792_c0_g1_i1.p1  ORF type:complete len:339 (+),score=-40.74 gnl/Spiro4/1476_TR792_c0_g1_i1:1400-2416(+)